MTGSEEEANIMPEQPNDHSLDGWQVLRRKLFAIAAGIATLAVLGYAAGYTAATAENCEFALSDAAMIALLVALTGLCAWIAVKLWPASGTERLGPRTRRAQSWFYWSVAFGGVLGAALSIVMIDVDDPFVLLGDGPLPALPIAIAIIAYLTIVPIISWRWWQNIDEHEADAYRFGALLAATLYLFVTPSWWFAWRAGLVSEPQHMLIFLGITLAWCAGWAWRRYR